MLSQILSERLAPLAPHAWLGGLEAGLHACLHLAPPLDAGQVAVACLQRGVQVRTLERYALGAAPPALLLGFGGLTRDELRRGCDVLNEVILSFTGP